ncbi:pyridoxamine 5'-phosphate oxidase family protein [Micromonospora sp. NBC_01699]|uniref:pyridoxamine 5'-phosphate oxidase family protein n=1 Tax=Micromonospora sp. NBC_01699 TaxID=2975984 RepID=UPI003FA55067
MASWSEFAADAPRLAEAIRNLLQQYGPGLGYLATVRADGGPRVHPVSPVINDEGLFCFVVDSPKRRDLERDGRYALHSFPPEESDDEAYVAGRAQAVTDPVRIARLADAVRAEPRADWRLFEFTVEAAMVARHGRVDAIPLAYGGRGGERPGVQVWLDPAGTRPQQMSRRGRRTRRHPNPSDVRGVSTANGVDQRFTREPRVGVAATAPDPAVWAS